MEQPPERSTPKLSRKSEMPSVGPIEFSLDEGFDSGIALLLVKPPSERIHARHSDYEILAAPDAPHAVCRFRGASSESEAYRRGSLLLQEALDLLSIQGRGDLLTRDVAEDHLLWWKGEDGHCAALVATSTFSIKLGHIELTVRDADGNVVQPTSSPVSHHLAFRFYRLAQASDDLFDAFRNMYLAFESLLSSKHPKGGQWEINWLRSALTAASAELDLRSLCPTSTPDPVDHILLVTYQEARLPLFHAKNGCTYFAPSTAHENRAVVQKALELLTNLVLRMADKWHSARRRSSWVNLKLLDQNNSNLYKNVSFHYVDDPSVDMKREPDSTLLSNSIPFPAVFREVFEGQERHHLEGQLATSTLVSRKELRAIFLAKDNQAYIAFDADTSIDVSGFDQLLVRLFVRSSNGGQPRYMYPR